MGESNAGGILAGGTVSPSNAIALSAAGIGLVSALAAGTAGYSHAKSVWEAANGGTAGLSEYITVGRAFWDALPIAAAVAVIVGMLAAGQYVSPAMLRWGAGLVGLLALAIGSQVDPQHLVVYNEAVSSGASDTAGLMQLWFNAYGLLAGVLAVIAGIGAGYAAGLTVGKNSA
jgi:hypothetical protein